MTIVRDKLEAALKAHERAAPGLVREALQHLDALEADARRLRALRYAAMTGDVGFFDRMGSLTPADPEAPTEAEFNAALDVAIAGALL